MGRAATIDLFLFTARLLVITETPLLVAIIVVFATVVVVVEAVRTRIGRVVSNLSWVFQ